MTMARRRLDRVARSLVQRYPPAWRERYEDEVLALFEDSPPGWRDVAELVRGLLVERTRALVECTDRPMRTLAIVAHVKIIFSIVFALAAMLIGSVMRLWTPSATIAEVGSWLSPLLLLAIMSSRLILLIRQLPPRDFGRPLYPAWLAGTALLVFFVSIVMFQWVAERAPTPLETQLWGLRWFNEFYACGMTSAWLLSDLWPSQRLLQALMHLQAIEGQLGSARAWVTGCHEMIALGVPSPLAEAEALVARWTRERDAARARVEQLGYRARFARS